jgi:hypothetical protein
MQEVGLQRQCSGSGARDEGGGAGMGLRRGATGGSGGADIFGVGIFKSTSVSAASNLLISCAILS